MKKIIPLLLLFVLVLTACGAKKPATPAPKVPTPADIATLQPMGTPMPKYGDVARALIRDFTNIGPRATGTPGESQAAQYVTSVFQAIGYSPETQTFTADVNGQQVTSANVIAMKQGVSKQEIIVGAHYDSTANGAGADEASGVAAMLEVARMVVSQNTPYTIRFIAFGAADVGLQGSYAYLNQMTQEEFENLIGMVDLDHLVAGDYAYAYSDEGDQAMLRDWAVEWASGNGLNLQTVRDATTLNDPKSGKGAADYSGFRDVGIRYVFFQSTDWNIGEKNGKTQVEAKFGENGVISGTKYDTLDYLDTNFPGRVDERLNLFVTVLYNLLTVYEVPIL